MDVFEAMETCRAIRYFKPDPVPEEMIEKVLHAATRAPSPGNSQAWDFIVITDPDLKKKMSEKIYGVMSQTVGGMVEAAGGWDALDKTNRLMLKGTLNMAENLGETPVIIIVCGKNAYPPQDPNERFIWSTVYPAAQNILLAARAQGLGTCFTTYQMTCEDVLRELLNIPDDVYLAAFIPMGFPDAKFGPLTRKPLEDVVHRNGW
ncbi:MAG: nitroreductase family protein [Alphaproteobacteria bacterium]|nr:nitroreductase family protein [Alphaproteobacteria bacterium]